MWALFKSMFVAGAGEIASLVGSLLTLNMTYMTSVLSQPVVQNLLWLIQIVGSCFFVFGTILAIGDWAVNYNEGSADPFSANIKNFVIGLTASLGFTSLPILLLEFVNKMCQTIISSASNDYASLVNFSTVISSLADPLGGYGIPIFIIIIFICIFKVFLSNIKRAGILFTLMVIGSVHLFSIPRGYTDAFWSWCKQIVALVVTSFVQNILIASGILIYADNNASIGALIVAAGFMFSSSEVPRILQQFGLDTSMKLNVSQALMGISNVMNIKNQISGS